MSFGANGADAVSRRGHERLYLSPDVRRIARHFSRSCICCKFQLITSSTLLDELEEKLCYKFQISSADVDLIRARIESHALLVDPPMTLKVVADDPDDDRVLECALAGEADYIVSGDRHLLKLASYSGVTISTVREFMDAAKLSG